MKGFEAFKRAVAFVMSYSFTEPVNNKKDSGCSTDNDDEKEEELMNPPMMVPMADMLNHVTKHNAKLTFGKDALKMVTIRNISKVQFVQLSLER